jgi:hypothetical protein
MRSRRLIAVPLVVTASVLLVAAVVDAGDRARHAAVTVPAAVRSDPSIAAEWRRIDAALAIEQACSGPADCTASDASTRLRVAADQIDTWPREARFGRVRSRLSAQLVARAAVLDQLAAMDADDDRTAIELERLDERARTWRRAASEFVDARYAAGMIDRDRRADERTSLRDQGDDYVITAADE